MRGERLAANGIRTPAQLFRGMSSYGFPTHVASSLYSHEKAHADADEERRGEFGFKISSGWVMAYYLVHGERTPEQRMKIAAAPGFLAMSKQDWKIYRHALLDWKKEEKNKLLDKNIGEWKESVGGIRRKLVGKLVEKFGEYEKSGEFPGIDTLLNLDYEELIRKYGGVLNKVYSQAISEVMNNKNFSLYLAK